jgi:hypothetical protein
MSLMIMSIGVSAVAVLFPISVLRSIQANQLTHGAIVKYNMEARLQTDPRWIVDPDKDFDLAEHFRAPGDRNYVVDPLGFYTHVLDGRLDLAPVYGNDGTSYAGGLRRWSGGLRTLDGGFIDESAVPLPPLAAGLTAAHLVALRLSALTASSQGDGWTTDVDAVPLSLISSAAGVIGVRLAAPADLDLTQVATSNLTLPGTAPNQYLIPDPEIYRIVLYSGDGRHSQAFPLTHIDTATNSVTWSEDTDGDGTGDHDFNMSGTMDAIDDIRPLPREFVNPLLPLPLLPPDFGFEVSRVLLQSRRMNDYSWLLTVRRRSDGFVRNVDIVVRFSEGVDPLDERLFQATFVKGTNVIGIRYPYRLNASDTTTPRFKRGKFVLDAQNALWYRVQDYKERPLGNIGWGYPQYDAIVYTETEIKDPGGEDQFTADGSGSSILLNGALDSVGGLSEDRVYPGDNDGNLDFGLAMFPTSVVDVYPMGSMKMPSSL